MGFLSDLGQAINEQFGFGENTVTSLDSIDKNGRVANFGRLGDFANKFDQSARRSYIEDGFIRNVRPRLREVIWQEPELTVVIKKRMFSSLIENFRLDLADENEKLFFRASKKLFQNKARAIAIYEKLSKIERISREAGKINSFLLPELLSGFANLEQIPALNNLVDPETRAAIEKIRRVFAFSEPTSFTTWVTDPDGTFISELGEGTGAIEFTTVANISTKSSVKFSEGSANISLEDPYKLMTITNQDIDAAISDATNFFRNSAFGRFTEIQTQKLIEEQKQQLNNFRQSRGASIIRFIVSPNTLISKRVRAIVEAGGLELKFTFNPGFVGFGSGTEVDEDDLLPSTRLGVHGLSEAEARLFQDIIKNIFLLLGFQNTSKSEVKEFNKETNFVRRKMRLHYTGKRIIQPMDVINIFITSRTRIDDKLIQGFELKSKGLSIGQKLDSLVRNINTNLGDLGSFFGGEGNVNSMDEVEKAFIVGADFPTWLWRLFRNDFTRQGAGTAIFVGLIKDVSRSYSDGKYMVNVACEDNAGYFNKSQINLKPAVDVFNSSLYDPLTPFNISFDAATGSVQTSIQPGSQIPELLDENKLILNSEAVRFKTGRFRGDRASEDAHQAEIVELTASGFRNVIANPDGFVYRWKEGIASLTKTERVAPESSIRDESSPRLTASPFAGQDVMNVLSLLVTGQPYNFNSFAKAALANANNLPARDDMQNRDAALTYLDALTDDLTKRNVVWGNFVPFKRLVINEDAFEFIRSGQGDFTTQNLRINSLLQRRAELQDELILRNAGLARDAQSALGRDASGQLLPPDPGSSITDPTAITLQQEVDRLDDEIKRALVQFQTQSERLLQSKPDGQIKIVGDDLTFYPNTSDGESSASDEGRRLDRAEFRRRIDFLTLRRLWKVKANEDINLFIVDDQYDKNWDIQGFERKIQANLKLFDSEYTSIEGQIKETAEILGLEIFADTQGHIQARPPQYNRVPSSVFHRMFRDKDRTGIQVFPQFLESLFFNQVQGLTGRIEIVEDEIRLRATALGINGDRQIQQTLRGAGEFGQEGFVFISDENTGKIGSRSFQNLIQQSKPDLNEEFASGPLKELSTAVADANRPVVLFDAVARERTFERLNSTGFLDADSQNQITKYDEIRTRLKRTKGGNVPSLDKIFSNDRFRRVNRISQLDALKLLNEIGRFVSERQKLVMEASNAIRNLQDGIELNESGKGATASLFPNLNRGKSIPSILEHMIEDEQNHALGPGSGGRYIIRDSQIISYSVSEVPPPHTLVQVNGLFGEGFVDAPQNLRLTSSGGNAVTSAFAVDYDMWRMYGFRAPTSVDAPFFSDPDLQCSPYAVYLLNLARKNILQANLTLVGNEYYQPGDVIYIEDDDLLFYVEMVDQNFNYSGQYQTSLTLKYGHTPGEYIPTILDIVGKILYNQRNVLNSFRSNRFDNANGDIPIGTLIYENKEFGSLIDPFTEQNISALIAGNYGPQNQRVLSNFLLSLTGALNPVGFRRQKVTLQLRVFFSSTRTGDVEENLVTIANSVRNWLRNPEQKSISPNKSLISFDDTQKTGDFRIPEDVVEIITVDVSGETEDSPSASAWSAVRTLRRSNGSPSSEFEPDEGNQESLEQDKLLYKHIIDAWLVFEDVVETDDTSAPGTDNTNQAAQEAQERLEAAREKRTNGS